MQNKNTEPNTGTDKNRILIVDDENGIRTVMSVILRHGGYEALMAASGEEAIELLKREPLDLVITDLSMGGGIDGMDLLRHVKEEYDIPVVMITAFGTVKVAIEAMRLGAYDFIRKPLKMEDIFEVVRGALWHHSLERGGSAADPVAPVRHFGLLVGESPAMQKTYRLIEQIAEIDVALLIQGEKGTGRSLTARAIHQSSPRRDGAFVELDCKEVAEDVLRVRLFAEKTVGDDSGTPGKAFEEARGGTLFLENIDGLPMDLQDRLTVTLKQLRGPAQTKNAPAPQPVCRIIAGATGVLSARVEAGTFSGKLYNALSTFVLDIPPLRRRPEDVPLLVQHFLAQTASASQSDGTRAIRLNGEAMQSIRRHSWPGNIDELRIALAAAAEKASGGLITRKDLPEYIVQAHPGIPGPDGTKGRGTQGVHAREFLRQKAADYKRILRQDPAAQKPPVGTSKS